MTKDKKTKFNFTLLKAFIQVKQDKEKISLKDILKPLNLSEKRLNKILNNEKEFTINEIFYLKLIFEIPDNMIKRVFFDKLEV